MKDKKLVELSKMEIPLKSVIKAGYNALNPGYSGKRRPVSHTMYYILSGKVEFCLGAESFCCYENDIIHLSDKEDAIIKNISKTNKVSLYYIMYELMDDMTLTDMGMPRVVNDSEMEYLPKIKHLYKTYLGEGVAYRMRLFGEFLILLCDLISGGFSHDETFGVNLKITKAVQYIRMNYYKNISLETLCDISGYSASHFRKLFVKTYGIPPSEYMINYRIRKAQELLLEDGEKTVEEIAELVGMCNASYFCKLFKEKTGISPHKYKNMDIKEIL